jgi:hypothetical protein
VAWIERKQLELAGELKIPARLGQKSVATLNPDITSSPTGTIPTAAEVGKR